MRVGGEVRGISFRPPRFDGPPWPGACVLANVAVDAERVRLHREVWQTNLGDRDAPIPLDATGVEHALEGLAAALTEHLHVPLCPSLTVSMDDALPWGRMASVLAALQGTVAPDEIEIEIELR